MKENTLLKNVLFINLDHRKDRLFEIKKEFEKLNISDISLERFPAIKHEKGAIGCALSHISCLEIAFERKYPYVFICEDDIQFLNVEQFLNSIKQFEKIPPSNWNVLIVSGNSIPPYENYNPTCVKTINCQTTTGYITHYNYYKTLINNFNYGVQLLTKYPSDERYYAIDQHWKLLQKTKTWYMIYPPCVIQRPSYSDIEKKNVDYTNLMLDTEKKYLFNNININKMNFL